MANSADPVLRRLIRVITVCSAVSVRIFRVYTVMFNIPSHKRVLEPIGYQHHLGDQLRQKSISESVQVGMSHVSEFQMVSR